ADKRLHEQRPRKFRQQFRGNAAAEIDSASSKNFESKVASFGAVDRDKEINRLFAERALALYTGTRNGCGRIGLGHFVDQPLGLPSAPAVAEKMKHVY